MSGVVGRVVRIGVPVALVVVLAALPLLDVPTGGILPGTLSSPGSLQLLALCLVFGALALSYDLLFGRTGLLSFGHALFFAVGAYGVVLLMTQLGWSLVPAALVTIAVGVVVAVLVGAVGLRVEGIAFAMVTLAFAEAGRVFVVIDPGGVTGGELGLGVPFRQLPAALVGVVNTRNVYWLALVLLVVVFAVVTWLTRSAPGRVWEAIRENERRVQVLGLRPYVFKLMSFVIAGTLGTMCGVVYVLLVSGANPSVATAQLTLTLLVMVVLGGAGTRWGPLVGGVLYTYLDQRLTELATSETIAGLPTALRVPLSEPLFVLGLLFVLIVMFLPGGIVGALTRPAAALRLPGRRSTADPSAADAGTARVGVGDGKGSQ